MIWRIAGHGGAALAAVVVVEIFVVVAVAVAVAVVVVVVVAVAVAVAVAVVVVVAVLLLLLLPLSFFLPFCPVMKTTCSFKTVVFCGMFNQPRRGHALRVMTSHSTPVQTTRQCKQA